MKHILLIRPDKAGDAIKTLPALRVARSQFPDYKFSVLCSTHNASVFAYEPGVRVFQLPPNWERLTENDLSEALERMPFPETFDKTVNVLCDEFPSVDLLQKLITSKEKFSRSTGLRLLKDTPIATPEDMNIAYLLGQALNADFISSIESFPCAPVISSADDREAHGVLGPKFQRRFAICAFAGTEQRSHSMKRWRSFVKLVARGAQPAEIYLLGTKQDREHLEFLRNGNSQIEILHPSSFRAMGAYLNKMDGVIAVDSGPLHLAQALGVPSLGILSGGDFRRWFSKLQPNDRLLPRGLFSRHPALIEMSFAFRKWCP